LTLQLGELDVDAALLGDRLNRSREIGVAQQIVVAHSADRRQGCDRLRTSATSFSKHAMIKTILVLYDIADLPI
jgi:hypothetical protein